MGKPVKLYDVWTDGSYTNAHHVGGAGWIIRHGEDDEREGWRVLKDFPNDAKNHGSDAAEIFGVSCALKDLPNGSTVKLRLDCQNVIDWCKAGRITSKSVTPIRFITDIFAQAMHGVARMESVEFIKVGGRSNEQLQRVNDLARKATHFARHGKHSRK